MPTTSDSLGRYYTAGSVGALLVSSLQDEEPDVVLDLGAGDGALTSAAASVWQHAKYYTVDIDKKAQSSQFHKKYGSAFVHHVGDALRFDIDKRLGLKKASADVALCNPPYIRPKWKSSFAAILEEAGLSGTYPRLGDVPADVLFIAQNLRFLKSNGRLGIIVPDGIISGEHCSALREILSSKHSIQKVIELPRKIFAKTDAKAHIVILSKGTTSTSEIEVQSLTPDGTLTSSILVPKENAAHRLDYTYLARRAQQKKGTPLYIRDVVTSVKRGAISSSERVSLDYPVLHTSDITGEDFRIPRRFQVRKSEVPFIKGTVAQAGDILVARVGRNLEKKICMLEKGFVPVSDCIFVVRALEEYRIQLFDCLKSNYGRAALNAVSRGVSARFLTTKSLLEIPLGTRDVS